MKQIFAILDFGSQYTWLIARRFRELSYYSEVLPYNVGLQTLRDKKPAGIILSGGPASVLEKDAPSRSLDELLELAPVLAICYGMQLAVFQKGGKLLKSSHRTYGKNLIHWKEEILPDRKKQWVWMSHGDSIHSLPPEAKALAQDERGLITAFSMNRLLALQFHPEVSHTEKGSDILHFFASQFCSAGSGSWTTEGDKRESKAKNTGSNPCWGKCFLRAERRGGLQCDSLFALSCFRPGQSSLCFCGYGLLRKGNTGKSCKCINPFI